jgi:hypothetical protein
MVPETATAAAVAVNVRVTVLVAGNTAPHTTTTTKKKRRFFQRMAPHVRHGRLGIIVLSDDKGIPSFHGTWSSISMDKKSTLGPAYYGPSFPDGSG